PTLPPPPLSTLFPYTTLFRSRRIVPGVVGADEQHDDLRIHAVELAVGDSPQHVLGLVPADAKVGGLLFGVARRPDALAFAFPALDRKSTRLNSSHVAISYAVF